MSQVGFYRIKATPSTTGTSKAFIYINNIKIEKTITTMPICSNELLVKFIDKNGMLKLLKFSKYYSASIQTSDIGRTSDFVKNIQTALTNQRNVGVEISKEISVSVDISTNEVETYKELITSQKVFIKLSGEWIEVIPAPNTLTIKPSRGKYINVSIVFQLPKQYSIRL